MLKRKLSKEDFEALSAEHKALYKVNPGDANSYLLEVEPDGDNGALQRAKAAEKQRADKAEQDLADAHLRIEELEAQASAGRPDVKALEEQYKAKETKLKADHKKEIEGRDKQLSTLLVDNVAMELATRISSTPELIADALKKRLKANLTGGDPVTEVLDANGLASTMTIEDLGKEFVANPKYSAIMIGSEASGGGARPPSGGTGSPLRNGKKFDDLSEAERTAWAKENPTAFNAASEANKKQKRAI